MSDATAVVGPPEALESKGVRLRGYHDLEGRPAFKLAMQRVDGRSLLYCGTFWHRGWSIVDVTDPDAPELVRWLEGPPNTWTLQTQVADGLLVAALEEAMPGWGIDEGVGYDEGVLLFDVATDPVDPQLLSHFRVGGRGTHRNFYAGGPVAVLAANPPGYKGNCALFLDVSDPRQPKEISRWSWPGQREGEPGHEDFNATLHGSAYVRGDRAYLSYGRVGMVVLDIADVARPELVARVSFGDLGSRLGCHSVVPIPDTDLIVVNDEAIAEGPDEPLNYTFVVQERGEDYRIVSSFPMPAPEPGLGYRNYYEKGGRFGPHNQHQDQGMPYLATPGPLIHMTYFNAGLRIFDISDPLMPAEVGYYVPEDPPVRRGAKPGPLVTQFEDVLVDDRGLIYCTDKNYGLFVLEATD